MKRYFNIIGIILGLIGILLMVIDVQSKVFGTLLPIFIIFVVGFILSLLGLVKYKNDKILSIIGIIINFLPIAYYIFLILDLA